MNFKIPKLNRTGVALIPALREVRSAELLLGQFQRFSQRAERELGAPLAGASQARLQRFGTMVSLLIAMLAFEGFSAFAQQTNHPNPRDFSAFQIITDRNIFDPNRRPRVQSRNPAPRVQQVVDSFSLVGTMSYSNVVLAFFEGTSSDYRKSLAVSNKIAAYTLTEIRQDAVKLALGTNEIELKVGMQMRRSEDGNWAAAERTGSGSNSYVASDRPRGNSRSERRTSQSNSSGNTDATEPLPDPIAAGGPPDIANLDTNDPVARLMLRRMQEENGGQSPARVETPAAETSQENSQPAPVAPPPDEAGPNVEPPPQ